MKKLRENYFQNNYNGFDISNADKEAFGRKIISKIVRDEDILNKLEDFYDDFYLEQDERNPERYVNIFNSDDDLVGRFKIMYLVKPKKDTELEIWLADYNTDDEDTEDEYLLFSEAFEDLGSFEEDNGSVALVMEIIEEVIEGLNNI